jgi:quercetin dioxygenase-like cupin family protein
MAKLIHPGSIVGLLLFLLAGCSIVITPPLPALPPIILPQPPPAPGEELEMLQLVLDFPPGSWSALHSHGGVALATVLEGELVNRTPAGDALYAAGESWQEAHGYVHQVGNQGTTGARLAVVLLLPKGAAPTIVQPGNPPDPQAPAPTLLYQARMAANTSTVP